MYRKPNQSGQNVYGQILDDSGSNPLKKSILGDSLATNYYVDAIPVAQKDLNYEYYVKAVDNAGDEFKYPNGAKINEGFDNISDPSMYPLSNVDSELGPNYPAVNDAYQAVRKFTSFPYPFADKIQAWIELSRIMIGKSKKLTSQWHMKQRLTKAWKAQHPEINCKEYQ